MKFVAALIWFVLTLSLAACGGGGLSVDLPEGEDTLGLDFPPGRAVEHRLPFRISGGIPPYESSIEGCPDWVTLFPDQGVLAGTAPVAENDRSFFCTYSVTESDPGFRPARTVTYGLRLTVGPLDRGDMAVPHPHGRARRALHATQSVHAGRDIAPCAWRRSRRGHLRAARPSPHSLPEIRPGHASAHVYSPVRGSDPRDSQHVPLSGRQRAARRCGSRVVNAKNADDALCLDVQFNPGDGDVSCSDPDGDGPLEPAHLIHIQLQVRDDAYWDEDRGEYRCPDTRPQSLSSSHSTTSNPVHTALAPVHARRAADVAHVNRSGPRARLVARGSARALRHHPPPLASPRCPVGAAASITPARASR